MKKRIMFLLFVLCLSCSISHAQDVYDVILFWGQSNMVGSCGVLPEEKNPQHFVHSLDSSSFESKYAFLIQTGIDPQIIENDVSLSQVNVPMPANVAYEYMELTHSFEDIKNKTTFGEVLYYNEQTSRLQQGDINNIESMSLQASYGTNMIPWFCKTYYEKTGRKVVAVLAANGGKTIDCFLPITEPDHSSSPVVHYIYEAMVTKYKNAIAYMEQNNMAVGKRLFVAYQGESDFVWGDYLTTEIYVDRFQRVLDGFKRDLNITQGAIVESGGWVNDNQNANFDNLIKINKAQKKIAENNKGVIIGSSYPYEHTLPADEATYLSDKFDSDFFNNWIYGKPPYAYAVDFVSKTRGLSTASGNNQIHFSAAALSQVGKECAINIAKKLDWNDTSIIDLILNGDMDGDGIITIIDVRLLLQEFINGG